MNLFKKQKGKKLAERQQKIAKGIAGQILKIQRKVADYLNRKSSNWTDLRWKLLLTAFCLSFGSYCIYLLWQAFY
ncbi:hypothetical protein [Pedobacter sp. Hv1]|uniref:hypothetical protein n=1 Tax=Pedobacter sp. Hv1 TaxID=1740090 RepID=UPI0006D8A8E0|nr:hypothetical protein [Pedobacter sp. Hv1]KQC02031.1 hypothetical protein AQF98_00205 [Pedobacter sp. Hv1]